MSRDRDRARVPAMHGIGARLIEQTRRHLGEPLTARCERGGAGRRQLALQRFEQRGHRGFGIARQRDVRRRVTLQLGVVRSHHQAFGADMDDLQIGLAVELRIRPADQIAHLVGQAPQIVRLERQDHIGLRQHLFAAAGVIELVAAREVHAEAAVDDGRVQKLGELDEQRRSPSRCGRSGSRRSPDSRPPPAGAPPRASPPCRLADVRADAASGFADAPLPPAAVLLPEGPHRASRAPAPSVRWSRDRRPAPALRRSIAARSAARPI